MECQSWFITGGCLLQDGHFRAGALALNAGRIAAEMPIAMAIAARRFDAAGLLVLPGLVDIHGDAHERQMQPRPGIAVPPAVALQDSCAQLMAAGITTAFFGVTCSWEPGLRGMEAWRQTLAAREAAAGPNLDLRIHCRFEADNLDAVDEVLADIGAGRVHLLAFNDHTPAIIMRSESETKLAVYAARSGVDAATYLMLAKRAWARRPEVPAALARLAAAARAACIPMLSHDDATPDIRAAFRALGATICEFPLAIPVAEAARAAGEAVVMGAPNVVRGGSHLGWAAAAPLAESGIVTILASDYWWPSMLQAAFTLADRGVLDLAGAWALVSTNPAMAAGLADRGRLSVGMRADVVLVEPGNRSVIATFCAGNLTWIAPQAASRFG